MRLLAVYFLKWNGETPYFITSVFDLDFISFFKRPFVKDALNFAARLATSRLQLGEKSVIDNANGKSYVDISKNGLSVVVIADEEYPSKVIMQMCREFHAIFFQQHTEEEFKAVNKDMNLPCPDIELKIKKYQDPKEADKLLKLQNNLEEVTNIMNQNLDDLLKRGETLDDLMKKSKDVSSVSYNFYKKARDSNKKCCSLV